MKEILLLAATEFEQAEIVARMERVVEQRVVGRRWLDGEVGGRPVRVVETGIGGVNTAHALTCVLQARRPALVLQIGVGGAYPEGGLRVGDVGLASEENYGDLGVRTPEGWQSAELIGIPVLERGESRYFNSFPLEREWVEAGGAVLAGADWDGDDVGVKIGSFVTVQECSGADALGVERGRRFAAICENMEGAAVAHLCLSYGLPFLEVRGISNLVEDRRREAWNLPLAAARAQLAGLMLLSELEL
ncbi:MAG: futalosine hydrolase [Gemmatimonadetes bacterium]|jgi:futalosine hydrolase|nr:futalosine hydrolase [Gemmatimonadota bacterium]